MSANGYPIRLCTNEGNPNIDNSLGTMVMEVLKKVVVTEADEIPKWIVPDSKHFGWIQGKYYPWPGNKVPSCFLTKRKKVPAPGVSECNDFF